jgi:PAS domain S-box-containing protein
MEFGRMASSTRESQDVADVAALTEAVGDLKPHDHLCLIYEREEEWRAAVVPFMAAGLRQGEKCFYVTDAHTAEQVRDYLREQVDDLDARETSGQFSIFQETEAYTREGSFDPDRMISLLISETEKAVSEGYPALRVTGEMTWALRGQPGSERLIEYESKLNRFFPNYPCLAICQYDRGRFPAETIKGIIMTHPLVIYGFRVQPNPFYIPPDQFEASDLPRYEVERCLDAMRAGEQIRLSELRYRTIVESAQEGIWEIDAEAVTTYVNKSVAEMLGYTPDEMQGRSVYDFMDANARPEAEQIVKRRKQGVTEQYDFRFQRKDGADLWTIVSANPLYDERGRFIGSLRMITDITARRQGEAALIKSNRALEMVRQINQPLVRAEDETHLLDEACRIAVEVGGYQMAWVGSSRGMGRLRGRIPRRAARLLGGQRTGAGACGYGDTYPRAPRLQERIAGP